jgi:hypothetical protein
MLKNHTAAAKETHLNAVWPGHEEVLPLMQVQPALIAVREAASTRAGDAAKHLVQVGVIHLHSVQ